MFRINKDGIKIHTTKDGVDIALKDMSDRHLTNLLYYAKKICRWCSNPLGLHGL